MTATPTIDLLVLGGGMAGLSAAAYAAHHGADVALVEKGPATGGSAAHAGFIHTTPTVEAMREVNPRGDPALGRRIVQGYDDALSWVRSLGVHVADQVPVLGYSRGCQTDMANYYVIEVVPAVTHPFAGLVIDDRARVLDAAGEPIPGLLAAGADAGGVFHRAYTGGLCAALVLGLQAATTAGVPADTLASHGPN